MKKVIVYFPDNTILAQYLLDIQPSCAEVNSKDQSLTLFLDEEDIVKAEIQYNAYEGPAQIKWNS